MSEDEDDCCNTAADIYAAQCKEPAKWTASLARTSVHRITTQQNDALITLLANCNNPQNDCAEVHAAWDEPGVSSLWKSHVFMLRPDDDVAQQAQPVRQLLNDVDPRNGAEQRVEEHITLTSDLRLLIVFSSDAQIAHSRIARIVVPCDSIKRLEIVNGVWNNPGSGMCGRDRLYEKLQDVYWGISRQVVGEVLRGKKTMQQSLQPPPMHSSTMPLRPHGLGHLQIDCTYMRNAQKFKRANRSIPTGILVVIDRFSRFVWAHPIKGSPDGAFVARYLNNLWLSEGPPVVLQSDNGTEFRNEQVAQLCVRFSVTQTFSRSHHPQANGAVERVNQTLKRSLYKTMIMYSSAKWWEFLPYVVFSYNTSRHRITSQPPFLLQRGFMPESLCLTKTFDKLMPRVKYATFDAQRQGSEGSETSGDATGPSTRASLLATFDDIATTFDNPSMEESMKEGIQQIRKLIINSFGDDEDAHGKPDTQHIMEEVKASLPAHFRDHKQIKTCLNYIQNIIAFTRDGASSDSQVEAIESVGPVGSADPDLADLADLAESIDAQLDQMEIGLFSLEDEYDPNDDDTSEEFAETSDTGAMYSLDEIRRFEEVVGIGRGLIGQVDKVPTKKQQVKDASLRCDQSNRYCVCLRRRGAPTDTLHWIPVDHMIGEHGFASGWKTWLESRLPQLLTSYERTWHASLPVREAEITRIDVLQRKLQAANELVEKSATNSSAKKRLTATQARDNLEQTLTEHYRHYTRVASRAVGIAYVNKKWGVWVCNSESVQVCAFEDFSNAATRKAKPGTFMITNIRQLLLSLPRIRSSDLIPELQIPEPPHLKQLTQSSQSSQSSQSRQSNEFNNDESTRRSDIIPDGAAIVGVIIPFGNLDPVASASPRVVYQTPDSSLYESRTLDFSRGDVNGTEALWSRFLNIAENSDQGRPEIRVDKDWRLNYTKWRVVGYVHIPRDEGRQVTRASRSAWIEVMRQWSPKVVDVDMLTRNLISTGGYIVGDGVKFHIGVDRASIGASAVNHFWSLVPGCWWGKAES